MKQLKKILPIAIATVLMSNTFSYASQTEIQYKDIIYDKSISDENDYIVNYQSELISLEEAITYQSELISLEEAIERGYTIVNLSELLEYELEKDISNRFTFNNTFSLSSTQWMTVPGSGGNLTNSPITFVIFNDEINPGNLAAEVMWTDTNAFIARNLNIPRGMGLQVTVPAQNSSRLYRINLRASNISGNYRVISMR